MIGRITRALAASIALGVFAGGSASAGPCVVSAQALRADGADERGMGGTGRSDERGMGGTGIIGAVTGFGSLCVNGLRIGYDAETPVDRAGQPIAAAQLRVGQSVVVRATGRGAQLQAERISLLPAVAGPVTLVDASAGRIEVMGQRVDVSARTLGTPGRDLARIAIGDFVEVHGLRDEAGAVRATRVDVGERSRPVLLAGPTREGPTGWRIGGTRVDTALGVASTFVQATGRWDAVSQSVVGANVVPVLPARPAFARVSIEAVVERRTGDRLSTTVLPIDVSRIATAGTNLVAGARIWASGELTTDGALLAESIDVDPIGGGEPYPVEGSLDDLRQTEDAVDDAHANDHDDGDLNDIHDGDVDDTHDGNVDDIHDGNVDDGDDRNLNDN